jgi:hypothetical protein
MPRRLTAASEPTLPAHAFAAAKQSAPSQAILAMSPRADFVERAMETSRRCRIVNPENKTIAPRQIAQNKKDQPVQRNGRENKLPNQPTD